MKRLIGLVVALVEDHIPRIIVAAITAVIIAGVVGRYVFSSPIIMANQLVVFGFFWATFLAIPLVVKEREEIAIPALHDALKGRGRAFVSITISVLSAVILMTIGVVSLRFALDTRLLLATMNGISKTWMWLAVPIGTMLAAARHVGIAVAELRSLRSADGRASDA